MKRVLVVMLVVFCVFGAALTVSATDSPGNVPANQEVKPAVLSKPVPISATLQVNGVLFRWNAVDYAENYRVFRKEGKSAWIILGDTQTTSFLDTTAVSGHTYRYTVRCVSLDGSETVSAFDVNGKTITFIGAPVIRSLTNAYGGVKIGWLQSNGAVKYRVFRKESNTGWKFLGDTTGLSFADKKAVSNHTYFYTVRCITANGAAYTSACDATGKSIHYIAAPVLKAVKCDKGGVSISWTKSDGAQRFRIFRKGTSGGWKKVTDTLYNTTYLDKSAVSGNKYLYTVRCVSRDGASYISGYNTNGKAVSYIAAPKITSVTNSNLSMTIKWSKSNGAGCYRVFYKVAGGSWKKLVDTTGTSYTYTHPARTETRYYTVRCMNKAKSAYISAYDTMGYRYTLTYYNVKRYGAGQYRVGTDLPAGIYVAYTSSSGYYCISSDPNGNNILSNNNFNNRNYLEVRNGEYVSVSRCEIIEARFAPKYTSSNGVYGSGQYLVGVDIPAGVYRASAGSGSGYYSVSSDPNGEDILSNDFFYGTSYVSVRNGEYLELSRCSITL